MQNTADLSNNVIDEVKAGNLYRHFKGDYYKIICIARDSETTEPMVVYQGLYVSKEWGPNPVWVRPLSNFTDLKDLDNGQRVQRFEKVDKVPEFYIRSH